MFNEKQQRVLDELDKLSKENPLQFQKDVEEISKLKFADVPINDYFKNLTKNMIMSGFYLKTSYNEETNQTEKKELFAHHNNTSDFVTIFDDKGYIILTIQDTVDNNILDGINRLYNTHTENRLEGVEFIKKSDIPNPNDNKKEFIEEVEKTKINFINTINNLEWNSDLRMQSENMIIMYDQMLEILKNIY